MIEEKMVPIDTSGNSVEVELKDETVSTEVDVPENNVREIIEEKVEEKVEAVEEEKVEAVEEEKVEAVEEDPYKTDDLADYSKTVKKRINNLVGRMREMERLYEASQQENQELKHKYTNVGKGYVAEYEGRVINAAEAAKSQLKKAIEDNDTEGQVAAQELLAQAKADGARLGSMKKAQKNDEQAYAPPQPQQQQQYQAPPPRVDTRADEWASENEWFGNDRMMTGAAMELHSQLVTEEGFDPTSNEYYNEVNFRMRKEFPHKFTNGKVTEEKKTATKQPVQTVASAVRKTKSGRRVVKLTPSQVAIAKRLNVPLEEYAKYVKE